METSTASTDTATTTEVQPDDWDWISVRDRFQMLSDCLEVRPDSHAELARELHEIADWINLWSKYDELTEGGTPCESLQTVNLTISKGT